MLRSYDDEYAFSSQDIFAAAITAAELAEVMHAPDIDGLEPSAAEDEDIELAPMR